MSEKPGRGYLPPTVPTPGVPLRHQWPSSQAIYNSAPQAWQPPPNKPYLTALSGSASPQSEGLDLTSTGSVGGSQATPPVEPSSAVATAAHNGDDLVVNGQAIKTTPPEIPVDDQNASHLKVSVIAPNISSSDESKTKAREFTEPDTKKCVPDVIRDSPAVTGRTLLAHPKEIAQNLSNRNCESPCPTPTTGQIANNTGGAADKKNSTLSQDQAETSTSVSKPDSDSKNGSNQVVELPVVSQPAEQLPSSSLVEESTAVGGDHVESLLENMFEAKNTSEKTKETATSAVKEEPVSSNKLSVIVTNVKSPALSEDKVVAILEDTPLEEKPEVIIEPSSVGVKKEGKSEADKKPDIMEVESELEKMFAGIVEPGSNDSSKVEVGESSADGGPKKKRRRVSRGKGRKSTDSSDLPVASPGVVIKRGRKSKQSTPEDKLKPGKAPKVKEERKGPYVRVVGPRDEPHRVTVVNSGSRLDDSEDRGDRAGGDKNALRRKRLTLVEGRIQAGSGLYSSTLSAKYNSHSADTTWVCVFCKMGPHTEKGLGGDPAGDLFGPYIVHVSKEQSMVDPRAPSDKDVAAEQKRRGGGKQLSLRAAGVADQFIKDMNKKSRKPSMTEDQPPTDPASGEQEIWVHEKCAIWAPGVLLVNFHLIGLADAISAASTTKCNHCGAFGASLGCAMRNCLGRCHYGCAVASSWYLDISKFIAACSNHAKQVGSS